VKRQQNWNCVANSHHTISLRQVSRFGKGRQDSHQLLQHVKVLCCEHQVVVISLPKKTIEFHLIKGGAVA